MTACTSVSTLTALYSDLDYEYNEAMSGRFWRPVVLDFVRDIGSDCICGIDYLSNDLSAASKYLLSQGYKATPYYTQIIDLTKTEEELRRGLRKSYKSLVNKDVMINEMCETGAYQRLHETLRGKTRPEETWDIQNQMIWDKEAFCLTQTHFKTRRNPLPRNTVTDAGLIVYYNEHIAYYASGAGEDCHALMWHAILKAKELGCKKFEMGEQVFDGSKLGNISKFKAGFGGHTEVRLILER